MSHIFISYSTKNSDYAYKLADKLRDEGFDVWIDNAKLRSSDNWWASIVHALRVADAFIVIMTPDSYDSRWVQREVTLADNWDKPSFPLLLDGENFEIYVLTQFKDVRDASLPEDDFYADLARFTDRKAQRGTNYVEAKQELTIEDSAIREALNNPPTAHEATNLSSPYISIEGAHIQELDTPIEIKSESETPSSNSERFIVQASGKIYGTPIKSNKILLHMNPDTRVEVIAQVWNGELLRWVRVCNLDHDIKGWIPFKNINKSYRESSSVNFKALPLDDFDILQTEELEQLKRQVTFYNIIISVYLISAVITLAGWVMQLNLLTGLGSMSFLVLSIAVLLVEYYYYPSPNSSAYIDHVIKVRQGIYLPWDNDKHMAIASGKVYTIPVKKRETILSKLKPDTKVEVISQLNGFLSTGYLPSWLKIRDLEGNIEGWIPFTSTKVGSLQTKPINFTELPLDNLEKLTLVELGQLKQKIDFYGSIMTAFSWLLLAGLIGVIYGWYVQSFEFLIFGITSFLPVFLMLPIVQFVDPILGKQYIEGLIAERRTLISSS